MKRFFVALAAVFSTIVFTGCRTEHGIRLMTYNVRNCRGMDDSVDYRRVAETILKVAPDVVAVQELDSMTDRYPGVDVIAVLGELTSMHTTYAPAIDYRGGKYGIGILSREVPLSVHRVALPGKKEDRALVIAEFDKYYFCSTHLSLRKRSRLESAFIIGNMADRFKDKPLFLAGDFNAEPYEESTMYMDRRFTQLNDPADKTFPADKPREQIDYIYVYDNEAVSYSLLDVEVVGDSVSSDHRPVYADVVVSMRRKIEK